MSKPIPPRRGIVDEGGGTNGTSNNRNNNNNNNNQEQPQTVGYQKGATTTASSSAAITGKRKRAFEPSSSVGTAQHHSGPATVVGASSASVAAVGVDNPQAEHEEDDQQQQQQEINSEAAVVTNENKRGKYASTRKSHRIDGRKYVEKNSLTEAQLIADLEQTRASIQQKREAGMGPLPVQDIVADRRAANRLSAFQSRQRRKQMLEQLTSKARQLEEKVKAQDARINALSEELDQTRIQNNRMRGQLNIPLVQYADVKISEELKNAANNLGSITIPQTFYPNGSPSCSSSSASSSPEAATLFNGLSSLTNSSTEGEDQESLSFSNSNRSSDPTVFTSNISNSHVNNSKSSSGNPTVAAPSATSFQQQQQQQVQATANNLIGAAFLLNNNASAITTTTATPTVPSPVPAPPTAAGLLSTEMLQTTLQGILSNPAAMNSIVQLVMNLAQPQQSVVHQEQPQQQPAIPNETPQLQNQIIQNLAGLFLPQQQQQQQSQAQQQRQRQQSQYAAPRPVVSYQYRNNPVNPPQNPHQTAGQSHQNMVNALHELARVLGHTHRGADPATAVAPRNNSGS